MYGIVLILVLIVMGGAIAYIGDKLGTKIGKKRISVFGLRPKHTSILMTIITGTLIALVTLASMAAISKDVRVALFGMEKLRAQLGNLNNEVASKNQEIQQALTQILEKNKNLAQLDATIKTNQAQMQALQQEKEQAQQDMQAAKAITAEVQQQYQQAQTSLQETLTTKKQLETDIVHLSSIAERLQQGLISVREGQIIFRAGELVASGRLTAGKNMEESAKELDTLMKTTNALLIDKLGIENKQLQVVFIEQNEVKNTLYKMSQLSGKVFVRLLASSNLVYGDPIIVRPQILPNELIYKRQEVILTKQLDLQDKDVQVALIELLQEINAKAINNGVIADPLNGTVGNLSIGEMLELTKNLQKYQNGLVNVIVRAKRDIYTSDLLSIDIEFEKI
ncbi:DUF3084 domain-containing protein [Succinispira mobilis]|uniref:DUF3084 domain-containing protein n=1 Tax=Succinispira mobilis TaxID=78120 RepID=UPI000373F529|nr:DUF3084 domain-containing protein [Succinispira mobilis]